MLNKKTGAITLSLALFASLVAACSSGNDNGDRVTAPSPSSADEIPSSSTNNAPQGYNGIDNLKITDSPSTIKLFYPFGSNGAPKGDMPIWKKVAEITNVQMENVANESISDDLQSFNTMMASGELPDIIQSQRATLNPIITQGALLSLDDLIEQYAPNIKQFLKDFPDARSAGSGPDGKLYTLTGTLGGEPGQLLPMMGFFIRQDWLDKLQLKTPTTLEEYKNVLYAFRNDDPNGNGKKDEVPYFYRDRGIGPLLQLWDAHPNWYIGADDKVHYGKGEQAYATALKELSQWYKDGIIDPEIFTRGSQARQFLLGNNIGGTTIDWFASTSAVNDAVKEQVPDINFTAIAPPADINGVVKMQQSRDLLHGYAWGISKDAKDPVQAIKYMDFFFTDTGHILSNFGIEGVDYDLVDGKPVVKDIAMQHPTGFPNYMRSIGSYEIGRRGNLAGEVSSMNEIGKTSFNMYLNSNWLQKPFPVMTFTNDEQKAIDDAAVNLMTLVDEFEQKSLMGAQDVDSTWQKHMDDMNKLGLLKAIDAYNSAYERYKSKSQ